MWLLGAAVALALVLAALEYNSSGTAEDYDSDLLDEIAEEMEFMPPFEDNDPLPLPEEKISLSDQIVVEDQQAAQQEEKADDMPAPPPLLVTETEETPESLDQLVEEEQKKEEQNVDKPLRLAEQAPIFPGGMMQLMKWLTKNLKYPEVARKAKISGKVVVAFMVNTDGSVSDVRLIKSVDPNLDREALRVVRMMPKWEPGMSDGKPSRTLVHLPIVFKF